MKKTNNSFHCINCEKIYTRWQGNCYQCHQFETIIETIPSTIMKKTFQAKEVSTIENINIEKNSQRIMTGIKEFDRVVGGGILCDSVILLSGSPGIGKSTFLLQIVSALCDEKKILYISTEETEAQIKLRFLRLEERKTNWFITQETSFEVIMDTIVSCSPEIVIIDSLQNISLGTASLMHHIQKIKEVTETIVEHAKKNHYVLMVTGHVTKDGEIAGPKSLEHLVDTVLYFEAEESSNLRILRSTKNRFGPIDEVGFFMMSEKGMTECSNPQEIFIENNKPSIGSALTWTKEGSRTFLIEMQTLLSHSRNHSPQRIIQGMEHKQFLLLCAIIEKYLKIPLYEFDIFSKVTGNVKFKDTHGDIAIIVSILSSYFNKIIPKKAIFHGEVSLSGNIVTKYEISQKLPLEKYGIELIVNGKTTESIKNKIESVALNSIYGVLKLFQ